MHLDVLIIIKKKSSLLYWELANLIHFSLGAEINLPIIIIIICKFMILFMVKRTKLIL